MTKNILLTNALCILSICASSVPAHAVLMTVTGGSASITIDEGKADSIYEFDAYFDATRTRVQTLSDPAPGNAPFTETPADPATGSIDLVDPIRPAGVAGTPGTGRSPQLTTLDFDPTSVATLLSSWTPSNDSFGFTGNTVLGEQIGLTSMQRYTGQFTGALLYGDFALRYTGSQLRLTSNIDFLNAEFAEIGNPTITLTANTLNISGDLLIDEALFLLDSATAVPGTKFGTFNMTATISAVPEAGSGALMLVAMTVGSAVWRRRWFARTAA
ncbi:MAG: hypothetical protein JNL18_25025 [Planctomycetaceae bacterium]|nr:hypothetical protein [Planctomycetaceae bacterium]